MLEPSLLTPLVRGLADVDLRRRAVQPYKELVKGIAAELLATRYNTPP